MPDQIPPTMILLHGAGVDHHWWHPQAVALSAEFPLQTPDLPGHGSRAGEPFRLARSIAELRDSTASLQGSRAILVGISLGGYVAAAFADRHPEMVSGLVICGASMNMNGLAGLGFRLTGALLRLRGAGWIEEKTLEAYRKRIRPEILSSAVPNGLFMQAAMSAFAQVSGRDYHRMLGRLAAPVLVLNGEGDEPNVRSQQELLDVLQNGSLHTIPAAGHLANLEQPETFTEALRTFARTIPA